jgi:hypothetical protein
VELAGSRARGEETALSDWDFAVEAPDFAAAAAALPRLVDPLGPLSKQWDRLSPFPTYMIMLRGPVKVDFLFLGRPNPPAPPWEVTPATLPAIDAHFWDWILWLVSKRERERGEQLELMYDHLLGPLGAAQPPRTAGGALATYLELRDAPSALEREVRPTVEAALQPGPR